MDKSDCAAAAACRGGCGFYGTSATGGYCSKCFLQNIRKTHGESAVSTTSGEMSPKDSCTSKLDDPKRSGDTAVSDGTVEEDSGAIAAARSSSSATDCTTDLANSVRDGLMLKADSPCEKKEKKRNRCQVCNKRVGLLGFPCRCGGLFCGEHRYNTTHECSFDYKTVERDEIRKNNPKIAADKIERI